MNKVYLIGNLTRDPEMRSTSTGIPVCNFSIAVNRRFKNAQTGQQETDFFNIEYIDYKEFRDVNSRMRRNINERGKIMPRRMSGNCAKHQRQLSEAIKRARAIALLPYTAE